MSRSATAGFQHTFVVRLYRCDPAQPETMIGMVEDVQAGHAGSFRSATELLRVLRGEQVPAVPDCDIRNDR